MASKRSAYTDKTGLLTAKHGAVGLGLYTYLKSGYHILSEAEIIYAMRLSPKLYRQLVADMVGLGLLIVEDGCYRLPEIEAKERLSAIYRGNVGKRWAKDGEIISNTICTTNESDFEGAKVGKMPILNSSSGFAVGLNVANGDESSDSISNTNGNTNCITNKGGFSSPNTPFSANADSREGFDDTENVAIRSENLLENLFDFTEIQLFKKNTPHTPQKEPDYLNSENSGNTSKDTNSRNLKKSNIESENPNLEPIKNVKRFVPPTIEELTAHFAEVMDRKDEAGRYKYCRLDPLSQAEAFHAFYDSKGWKVGSNKMEKWKAAVMTWVLRYCKDHPNVSLPTQSTKYKKI